MDINLQHTKQIVPAAPQYIYWPRATDNEINNLDPGGTEHLHWVITAFYDIEENFGNFKDAVTIEVEAPNEQAAIARAMKIIARANYRITSVREVCSLDEALKNDN